MSEKTIQQLMCDPIFHDYEIAVSAQWLQDVLKDREQIERLLIGSRKHIDILETKLALKELDYPMYRLNIKG